MAYLRTTGHIFLCLDPIQTLFLESIRSKGYGGLENASPAIKAQLDNELQRLAKQVMHYPIYLFVTQRILIIK